MNTRGNVTKNHSSRSLSLYSQESLIQKTEEELEDILQNGELTPQEMNESISLLVTQAETKIQRGSSSKNLKPQVSMRDMAKLLKTQEFSKEII